MIAIALLISNAEALRADIEQQQKANLPAMVKPEYTERQIGFSKHAIGFAFLMDDGNIKTIISGQEMLLKFEKKVWTKLMNHFKNN
jgi:hypothetical protein